MAQVLIVGPMALVEITWGTVDEELVTATCIEHSESDGRLAPPGNCSWTRDYDTTDDAIEYSQPHAATGEWR